MARKSRRPRPALNFEQLENRSLLATDISLIKDATPYADYTSGSLHTVVGNRIFYFHGQYGRSGLYVTDGTPEGTVLLKQSPSVERIVPVNGTVYFTTSTVLWKTDGTIGGTTDVTAGTSELVKTTSMANANGKLVISRTDAALDWELWVTSPDTNKAVLLKDILPGSFSSSPRELTEVNGNVYFSALSDPSGTELWKTDGTAVGTTLVKDISLNDGRPANLVNVGGTLYFSAETTTLGRELWKSDGTAAGTTMVVDATPGQSDSQVHGVAQAGSQIFFEANNILWKADAAGLAVSQVKTLNVSVSEAVGVNGLLYFVTSAGELWRSDGSAAGTERIRTGSAANLFGFNNLLYFRDANNKSLWKSDGTISGTATFEPSTTADPLVVDFRLFQFKDQLAFGAYRKSDGGIWLSDGSAAGTRLFTRLFTYNGGNETGSINGLSVVNDIGYFTKGQDFWRTDGSYEGTYLLQKSLMAVRVPGTPEVVGLGSRVLFPALVPGEGVQLWSTDSTAVGTTLVKKFGTPTSNTFFGPLTRLGTQVLFLISDSGNLTLWKSDGTEAGTQIVKTLTGDGFNPSAGNWKLVGNTLYFTTKTFSADTFWKTDGTSAGTIAINTFARTNSTNFLTEWNGFLYFFADNGSGKSGLWRVNLSDNSFEFVHGLSAGNPKTFQSIVAVNNKLFILDASALWVSDGTTVGTSQLMTQNNLNSLSSLIGYKNKLYFVQDPASSSDLLWVSDGTLGGTSMLKPLPNSITTVTATLYVLGNDLIIEGRSFVYISDGTAAGTVPWPTPINSPTQMVEFNFQDANGLIGGYVVFAGLDNPHGEELFTYATTDHGDAPFASRAMDSGAEHIDVGPRLGTRRDTDEVDGLPSLDADGDDSRFSDDEDGLVTVPSLAVGVASDFDFVVNDATAKTKLYGWFDWNLDGDWNDAGERMIDGASVVNGTNRISIAVPNSASNGTVYARFRIGDQAAMGPLGLATSGEVEDYLFKMGEDLVIDLSSSSNNIVVQKAGDSVQAIDATTSQVLVSQALNRLRGLIITGSATKADSVKIDYASGGFFALPAGIKFDGIGGNDSVSIVGTNSTRVLQGTLPAASGLSELLTSEGTASGYVRFTNAPNIDFSGFQSFALSGTFDIGARTISIGSATPVELGSTTLISDGKLTTNAVRLSSGDTLVGKGQVAARMSLDIGTSLRLNGDMQVGDASSNSGFASQGTLDTAAYRLTLLDADTVELSGQVLVGNTSGDGILTAANGLTLASNTSLIGRGTIDTPNSVNRPLINQGSIQGLNSTQTIVLPGYMTGSGTMNWARVTGTYDPGTDAGTAAITHGSVTYAGKLLLFASGATAGTQFDQLNHTGTATLGGELNVQFLNTFMLDFTTKLPFIKATQGVVGTFGTTNIPSAPVGSTIHGIYTSGAYTLEREQLTLNVIASTINEKGGSTTGTVARTGSDLSQAVVVQLTNGDPSELSIPASVTIEAGKPSVDFTIAAVDDSLLDGVQRVTITATAASIGFTTLPIDVTDREALLLTLDANSIAELNGKAIGTVTRENTDRDLPLEVQIVLSKPGQATAPQTVTILAGQGSATFDINAIDDTLLDGAQTLSISVSATGYDGDQQSLEVADSEQITLQLDRASISEKTDSAVLTVTRSNTDNSEPLTVQLQGSDSSELQVPASVTIAANQSSATVTLQSVDDASADGPQSVDIRAQAAGYVDGVATLVVQDYEALQINIFATSMSEKGGSISGMVLRNVDDLSQSLQVTLSTNNATEATVDATVTIPAFQSFAPFTLRAQDDALLDGTRVVTVRAEASGYIASSADFSVTDLENLTLAMSPPSVAEDAGTTLATVTRSNTDTEQPLVVTVSTTNTGNVSLPSTVTIDAGKSSASFPVTILDNDLLDGTRSLSIDAKASGYVGGAANLQIRDSERLTINLLAQQTTEGGASIQGSVVRSNTNNSNALTVTLISDKTSKATVPPQITIPANQASANFTISIKDDSLLDGSQVVQFTATASGYVTGSASLTVLDNEALSITIDKSTISEAGGTATATVTRNNTDRTQPLLVNLSADVSSEIAIPSSVTIPADAGSATFAISANDNAILDGTRSVAIQAAATGYVSGSASLDLSDSESLTISISTPNVAETVGTVSGIVARSNTNVDQPLTVALSSSNTSKATVPAQVTIPQGQTEVQFTIIVVNDTVFSTNSTIHFAATASGYTGDDDSLTISDDDRAFPWQNSRKNVDVNDDGLVTAIDALLVINAINTRFQLTSELLDPPEYLDVNGDNNLSPIDALLVINALNNPGQAEGEFELGIVIDLVAEDIRKSRRR